jgi:predicted membrane channel-forming protein YqfA (hemolysin III family)
MTPIQLSLFEQTVGILFFVGTVVSIVVGLFVAYRAIQAYRRTERRSLLLFSVGLLLLVSVSKLANILLASSPAPPIGVGPATELLRLGGALIITYAIYDR